MRKYLPGWFKRLAGEPLRRLLFPGLRVDELVLTTAGGPGESPNYWWAGLEKAANASLFPVISDEAQTACTEIREAYRSLLAEYNLDFEQFFWGSIKHEEAAVLYQMVRERKPRVAYQIGTFAGYSALVIAHALRANGQGVLLSLDPEIPHRAPINPVAIARQAAEAQGLSEYIQFIKGWHSIPMGDYLGLQLKREIPNAGLETLNSLDASVDFAFIDGDHSTACTLADFLLLKDFVGVGGVVVFHDAWSWPTVAKAVHTFWQDIHYLMRGTSAYFSLDVRRGIDGLAALERVAEENYPMLRMHVVDAISHHAVAGADIHLPELAYRVKTGNDGVGYCITDVPPGVQLEITHPGYHPHHSLLSTGTHGDFASVEIALNKL